VSGTESIAAIQARRLRATISAGPLIFEGFRFPDTAARRKADKSMDPGDLAAFQVELVRIRRKPVCRRTGFSVRHFPASGPRCGPF